VILWTMKTRKSKFPSHLEAYSQFQNCQPHNFSIGFCATTCHRRFGLIGPLAILIIVVSSEVLDDVSSVARAFGFLLGLVRYILVAGFIIATFNAIRVGGNDIHVVAHAFSWKDFTRGVYWFFPTIGIALVTGIAVLIGLFLFVVPGLYLGVAFSFVIPLYVEYRHEGIGFFESFMVSNAVVWKHFCGIVWMLVVSFLLLLIGAICLGVGVFVAIPVMLLMYCFAFRDMFGVSPQRPFDRQFMCCCGPTNV